MSLLVFMFNASVKRAHGDAVKPRSHLGQSETNRNDGNAMCDYLSEYLRMCFRLYEDSSRPFLNILRTFCERSKLAED